MVRVVEINRFEELSSLQLTWRDLWGQTRRATFFQSFEWFSTYWQHFGSTQKLRLLAVYSEGSCVGLLPLVVRTETTRVGPVRVLTYPLDNWGSFYGPIGPHPTVTLLAGLRHIGETDRDWDVLDLRWVDATRCDHRRTPTAMEQVGLSPSAQVWYRSAVIDLRCGWETYWADRSSKSRNNLRRAEKRVRELGRVELVRYRPRGAGAGDDDPRWDLYDACVELAAKSWQARRHDGNTLCHPQVKTFLEDAHVQAVKLGCLDLNLLTVDGTPVAFAYNYIHEGRVFGLRTGFDPAWVETSPGNVLKLLMIRDSFFRGDAEFDLGTGSLESKTPWATDWVDVYRYTHFSARSARAHVLRLKRWWDNRFASLEKLLFKQSA